MLTDWLVGVAAGAGVCVGGALVGVRVGSWPGSGVSVAVGSGVSVTVGGGGCVSVGVSVGLTASSRSSCM